MCQRTWLHCVGLAPVACLELVEEQEQGMLRCAAGWTLGLLGAALPAPCCSQLQGHAMHGCAGACTLPVVVAAVPGPNGWDAGAGQVHTHTWLPL